jgi:putative PIN family toxin of toxin-antitoxin system
MPRIVIDAGVFVSAAILSRSVPRKAFDRALTVGTPLLSDATFDELYEVVNRKKFDRYSSVEYRQLFFAEYFSRVQIVDVAVEIRECRDPNDDMYLELAVSGNASHIVTGDADLLALHPFRGIEIVTPQEFLIRFPDLTRP